MRSDSRRALRELLAERYLYSSEKFKNRCDTFELPGDRPWPALSLKTKGGKPFLLGVTAPDVPLTSAADRAFDYALGTETIGLIAVSNVSAEKVDFYRRRFDSSKFDRIPELEYYFRGAVGVQGVLLEESGRYGEDEPGLLPISHKLENLFFEIHSLMRDIDGLHADAALEELCKLIYVKAYIEEQGPGCSEGRVHSAEFGCTEEYAAAIRGLYRESIDYDLRVFRLRIPQYERSRGVFQDPIKLSSAALVKSFQQVENYSLSRSKADVKGRAFQKVLGRAVRSGMGQYFTPAIVCDLMVTALKPRVHDLILDPFCGSGHFLSQSLSVVGRDCDISSKEYHEFAFGKLHGIEKSDRMTRIAMTDMRLSGDGHSNIRCADALLSFENYPDISPNSFDIVLTNPPFGSLLGTEALAQLGPFELGRGRRSIPLEIIGLERAISFLRPGGRIGIVLPETVFSAESTQYVRSWLKTKVKVRSIISLPIETFSPFGANVKTCILFARKWSSGEELDEDFNVLMLCIENVGYDASGRATSAHDLKSATEAFDKFIEKEGW